MKKKKTVVKVPEVLFERMISSDMSEDERRANGLILLAHDMKKRLRNDWWGDLDTLIDLAVREGDRHGAKDLVDQLLEVAELDMTTADTAEEVALRIIYSRGLRYTEAAE